MTTRFDLHNEYMHRHTTGKSRSRVERAFAEWEDQKIRDGGVQGAATPITTLRTRWNVGNTIIAVPESEEIDFNIALRQGIEIFAVYADIDALAVIAAGQRAAAFVDLDGPALANNSINTIPIYDARKILESVIANFAIGVDALTSGGAKVEELQSVTFPIPVLTARNVGIARASEGGGGESLIGIQHRFVEINRDENLELFALGRA